MNGLWPLSTHIAALCAVLTVWSTTASAQTQAEPRLMSLTEAMQLASEQSYTVLLAGLDRDIAAERAGQTRGAHIPVLSLDAEVRHRGGAEGQPDTETLGLGATLRWGTPWGTALTTGALANETLAGALAPHGASLFFTLAQSLLRGGWEAGAYTPVLEADLDREIQRAEFRRGLNGLLVDVEEAYWELAFAQDDLAGQIRSLERARDQFNDTRENIKRGLLAEADVHIVEENVVIFEEQVVRARETLTLARSRVARLLQMEPGAAIEATDSLTQDALAVPELEEAVGVGLEGNPGLEASRARLRRAKVRLAFDLNQARPVLDLEASLTLNGAGEAFADPWSDIAALSQPDLRVGVVFEVPIGDDANEARVARGRLEKRRALLSLKDQEAQLRFRIRDLLTNLDTQASRLALAQRRVKLARLKLDAQMERYKSGISTLDEVVRFQRDLDGSLIAERRVRVQLLTSRSRLREAQGTLHRAFGVEVK